MVRRESAIFEKMILTKRRKGLESFIIGVVQSQQSEQLKERSDIS